MLEIRAPSGHLTKQTAEPHLKLLFLYGSGLILTYNHFVHLDKSIPTESGIQIRSLIFRDQMPDHSIRRGTY